eukprot:31330-Pelagococcus_subviridis.AAC.10
MAMHFNVHVDAARHLGYLARYINDDVGGGDDGGGGNRNVKFVKDASARSATVQTLRDIAAGEELYAEYGEGYWRHRGTTSGAAARRRVHVSISENTPTFVFASSPTLPISISACCDAHMDAYIPAFVPVPFPRINSACEPEVGAESKGVRGGVERRRGVSGLKPRDCGRRVTNAGRESP